MSRVYNITSSGPEAPDEDRNAARRMVARHVTDPAERGQVENMLGLTS